MVQLAALAGGQGGPREPGAARIPFLRAHGLQVLRGAALQALAEVGLRVEEAGDEVHNVALGHSRISVAHLGPCIGTERCR